MRGVVIGLLFATSGCSVLFGLDNPVPTDSGGTKDVGSDTSMPVCVGVGKYLECLPVGIVDRLDYTSNTTIITDQQCPIVDSSNPSWCIYAARHVAITGTVRATGSRFFVLIGTEDLTIGSSGVVDVASHVAMSPGAGLGAGAMSGFGTCTGLTNGGGSSDVNGGGGGAGGTYTTTGGNGGSGGGGTGGTSAAVDPAGVLGNTLRSGCAGANGGSGTGSAPDPGGAGGGGVYLASKGTLAIDGTINASGAGGGRGNTSKGGGSGGGSGGMIALWATTLVVNGNVFANGGGGGGGADNGVAGSAGGDSNAPASPGHGGLGGGISTCGAGPGCGGDGAAGGSSISAGRPGYNDTTSAGGGGGGGGLGLIKIVSGQMISGNFSPPPITN